MYKTFKARVSFYTYREGETSGLVVPLGPREMEVIQGHQQVSCNVMLGCTELKLQMLEWIVIRGRVFVLDYSHNTFSTAIPQELAKELFEYCPHCLQLIKKS